MTLYKKSESHGASYQVPAIRPLFFVCFQRRLARPPSRIGLGPLSGSHMGPLFLFWGFCFFVFGAFDFLVAAFDAPYFVSESRS
jgi:hypothetical protein